MLRQQRCRQRPSPFHIRRRRSCMDVLKSLLTSKQRCIRTYILILACFSAPVTSGHRRQLLGLIKRVTCSGAWDCMCTPLEYRYERLILSPIAQEGRHPLAFGVGAGEDDCIVCKQEVAG